jgi:c(7)-type cytochrome triheme protein
VTPSLGRKILGVQPYVLFAALGIATFAISGPALAADSTRTAPPPELRLPADIVFGTSVSADSAVTFSHVTHVGFAGNTCTGCHPKPFRMLHPTRRTNHAAMASGTSCGACHDGKQAFGVREAGSCGTCHVGRISPNLAVKDSSRAGAATAAARKLPQPHTYPAAEYSPGRVTFRHESHVKRAGGCAACHPRPFPMRSAPPRPDGGMHEAASCGACHNGSAAFAADDQAACGRCHIETAGKP